MFYPITNKNKFGENKGEKIESELEEINFEETLN